MQTLLGILLLLIVIIGCLVSLHSVMRSVSKQCEQAERNIENENRQIRSQLRH